VSKDEIREQLMASAQGAQRLNLAYIGISAGLWTALGEGARSVTELAEMTGTDVGYLARWADAAFAFELVDVDAEERLVLTPLGAAFDPDRPNTCMPFAVMHVLSAHMSERAAGLLRTGVRPGEAVLAERETILPWFGPMLEATFGPVFEQHILPRLSVFEDLADRGLVLDLGCGNGWYLRRLAARYPQLRGLGLDGFEPPVAQARAQSAEAGLGERLEFRVGDLTTYEPTEPLGAVVMNRALHHVWPDRAALVDTVARHLAPGGAFVIWEPAWPAERATLRSPAYRMMAVQNLSEHVQGNHFLQPEEVAEALSAGGLVPEVHRFLAGNEAVIVGRRPR
jgi:SAM-dependent methyltransferase